MKTLIMSIFCTFICASLFAQVDSTSNMNSMPPPTMNTTSNNVNDSTSNNTNNSNSSTNSDSSKVVTPPATQGTMDMNANSNSNANMNMNATVSNGDSNLVNPNNIPGQADYASLPVMETFVQQNIVEQVKEKFPNQVVYDITAVKAPVDSASMQNDSMMNHPNATAMNSDSSMNMNQNSTMNMNQNNPTTNGMATDTTQMPEKFNYVVRVLQNGQMTTQTLESDGTAMLKPARQSGMNNELNQ